MITINTKYGMLYADYDEERINIYDSNQKWLDYISLECLDSANIKELTAYLNNRYNAYNGVDDMLEQEGIQSYTVSEDWQNLLEDIMELEEDYTYENGKPILLVDWNTEWLTGMELTQEFLLGNECINKIGNMFVYYNY